MVGVFSRTCGEKLSEYDCSCPTEVKGKQALSNETLLYVWKPGLRMKVLGEEETCCGEKETVGEKSTEVLP